MEPDWANLEALGLGLVLDKLEERIDHVWFAAVCKNWQSAAKLNHQYKANALPMLLKITRKSGEKSSLYGIPTERTYSIPLHLPPLDKICRGSSYGWLAIVDGKDVITLLNPFKYISPITLPPLDHVYKVTLSTDPVISPNDYVVAAIYGTCRCLAFIRAGQAFWTYIKTNYDRFTDIIFYRGLVYAVSDCPQNRIVSFKLCYSDDPFISEKITLNIVLQENEDDFQVYYLVKSLQGDLWMVRRCLDWFSMSFDVYKLELDPKSGKLQQRLKLVNLEDNVLFLGNNDSISVPASYFARCLQNDSIYFPNDFGIYLAIYNVKDGSFHRRNPHCFEEWTPFQMWTKWTTPLLWVLPPFQWD